MSGPGTLHDIKNNIAMSPGTAINNLTGGTATFNSWNLSVTVSSVNFQSVDETLASAPRETDGSLPANAFMRLATGGDLIDAGTDVGLPYNGSAPDLGAFAR